MYEALSCRKEQVLCLKMLLHYTSKLRWIEMGGPEASAAYKVVSACVCACVCVCTPAYKEVLPFLDHPDDEL